ncbi:Multisubstrate pseudouridine synthase 7 [Fulvia fulva]|nr:Multisubstrate pseudouridine synthase 7 [Fulvia fulva]KAK4632803.1 Multisubstrate pseudouridine synthase 7 [Fulvia fulva]WPV11843.1 Multisubstrate pseudouridine synthase 7 [Fulvia fulva]WPV26946.1 Multisubstrate pseudouridine synthase 7 [Fulvia fulva]
MATVEAVQAQQAQQAQERAVGISVYVQPKVPGFRCIVKQRYTDFLVNEILPNGEVLHLTELATGSDRKRKRENDAQDGSKKQRSENDAPAETATVSEVKEEQAAAGGEEKTNGDAAPESKSVVNGAAARAAREEAVASISAEDITVLKGIFDAQTVDSIVQLYADVVAYPDRKPRDHASIKSEPLLEKSKRTEAHMCVRRIFKSKLETTTIQSQDQQSGPPTIISLRAAPAKVAAAPNTKGDNRDQQKSDRQRGRQNWAELGGEYLHFTLYKENKDTMEVLNFIGAQLKMHIKHFSFAGTKDRRGVTVQRVAIHRVLRQRIEQLNKMARGRSWRLGGPWEYRPEGLELGMLSGNEFLLTLRDATFDGEDSSWDMSQRLQHARTVAQIAADSLAKSGYLNYYGLQRFGSYKTGTHVAGMRMLKGDLQGAVDAILAYDELLLQENQDADPQGGDATKKNVPQEDIDRATAIHQFRKNGNSGSALRLLPMRFAAERGMITHLGKRDRGNNTRPNENDFQGALMQIQRNLRLMYVHAYQSFVWNTIVGKRWELFGNSVVEGDLVVVGEKEKAEGKPATAPATKQEVDENGEPIIHPSASTGGYTETTTTEIDDPYVRARPLSKEEAESGRFSVFDLVLPLPGYDVIYPTNSIGTLYSTFMASDEGGAIDPHNMRRGWKDISLSGGYRKVMSRPLGDGVKVVDVKAYAADNAQMVQTDLEKLEGSGVEATKVEESGDGKAEKDKIAVVLKMRLGSSQYATMALRELTKGGATGYTPMFSVVNR